jgi:hypothetical protein
VSKRVGIHFAVFEYDSPPRNGQNRPATKPHSLVQALATPIVDDVALLIEINEYEISIRTRV